MHSSIFPPYYLGILSSAEHTGRLDEVLDQLADYMERDGEATQKLKSAIMYPIVIALAAIGVVVLMATYVLPKLTKFFEEFDAKLPLSSRILMGLADFFKNNVWFMPTMIGLVVAIFLCTKMTRPGRELKDKLLLKLWLSREIVRYAAVERFCRIIGAMMQAGCAAPRGDAGGDRRARTTPCSRRSSRRSTKRCSRVRGWRIPSRRPASSRNPPCR